MAKIKWSKEMVIRCIQERKFSHEIMNQPTPTAPQGNLWDQIIGKIKGGGSPPSSGAIP